MSVQHFIPTIWSEALQKELDQKYVGVANCTREFEGEIKKKGSRVKALTLGDVRVCDYTPNSDMSSPDTLEGISKELEINRAKYFNFQLDDVDRAQAVPGLMEAAMKNAADALAREADRYIYSLWSEVDRVIYSDLTGQVKDVIPALLKARTTLMESGVTDVNEIFFEISPKVAEILLKNEVNLLSDNGNLLENGCIGKFAGCKVFVSNNIATMEGGASTHHYCFARSRRAIAFAEQISEIEAYRPESRFADAVKGLHLYGAKIMRPQDIILIDASIDD